MLPNIPNNPKKNINSPTGCKWCFVINTRAFTSELRPHQLGSRCEGGVQR